MYNFGGKHVTDIPSLTKFNIPIDSVSYSTAEIAKHCLDTIINAKKDNVKINYSIETADVSVTG